MQLPLADELKRIQRTARDALRAVREFENGVGGDLYGQIVVEEDEEVDEELLGDVEALLKLARQQYPQTELRLIVVAQPRMEEEQDNGKSFEGTGV